MTTVSLMSGAGVALSLLTGWWWVAPLWVASGVVIASLTGGDDEFEDETAD